MSLNTESVCAIMGGLALCTIFVCMAFGAKPKDNMSEILWACQKYNISEANCYEAIQRAETPDGR